MYSGISSSLHRLDHKLTLYFNLVARQRCSSKEFEVAHFNGLLSAQMLFEDQPSKPGTRGNYLPEKHLYARYHQ